MDVVIIVQLSAIILITGVFAWLNIAQHKNWIPPRAIMESILLAAFVAKNSRVSVNSAWFERPNVVSDTSGAVELPEQPARFLKFYRSYHKKHSLSDEEILPENVRKINKSVLFNPIAFLLVLVISPFTCVDLVCETRERNKHFSWYHIVHPLERSKNMLYVIGPLLFVSTLIFLAVLFLSGIWCLIAVALPVLSLGLMVFCVVRLIWCQSLWKEYWSGKLLAILQRAAYQNDHDLYNRAFNVLSQVESRSIFPLGPIPRFVIIVFAVVQFLAPQIVKSVQAFQSL